MTTSVAIPVPEGNPGFDVVGADFKWVVGAVGHEDLAIDRRANDRPHGAGYDYKPDAIVTLSDGAVSYVANTRTGCSDSALAYGGMFLSINGHGKLSGSLLWHQL